MKKKTDLPYRLKKNRLKVWSAEILVGWKFSHLAKILVTFNRLKNWNLVTLVTFNRFFFSTDIFSRDFCKL